jgi:glycosyltransferase involved in cell wall biosynthesis
MRIALYHNLHSGGAKRMVVEHLSRLSSWHEVTLFSLNTADNKFADRGTLAGITTNIQNYKALLPMLPSPFGRINPVIGLINIAHLNQLALKTAKLIDDQHFDVVLIHPCYITQAPLVLNWLQTPTLYYCHELPRRLYEQPIPRPYINSNLLRQFANKIDPLIPINRSKLRLLDLKNASRATQLITNSNFTCNNILRVYNRMADICYPGVDTAAFQPISCKRESFVLSVGALTPSKGFDFLIKSIGTITAHKRPHLNLISNYQEQEERDYLQNLAYLEGVELKIHLNVSEIELQHWYARAGCVAYAPVQEPFGLVVLEAMAATTPVVGVKEGGITESIVHGENGLLVGREPKAFGQAIQELLDKPDYAKKLGSHGRISVLENWTWEKHMEQLEMFLQQIAKKNLI